MVVTDFIRSEDRLDLVLLAAGGTAPAPRITLEGGDAVLGWEGLTVRLKGTGPVSLAELAGPASFPAHGP